MARDEMRAIAATFGAWIAGAIFSVLLLEFGAYWGHYFQYRTHAENWWFLYTVPCGALFGATLAGKLRSWSLWLGKAGPLSPGTRVATWLFIPFLFVVANALLLGVIFLIGHTLTAEWAYPSFLGLWLLFLFLGRPPRDRSHDAMTGPHSGN